MIKIIIKIKQKKIILKSITMARAIIILTTIITILII
jgi:hypothetical protein